MPKAMLRPACVAGEDAAALELGLRRLDEIRGAADHRRRVALERLHHLRARVARRDLLAGLELRQRLDPARPRLAGVHLIPVLAQRRVLRRPRGELLLPRVLERDAAVGDVHVLAHLVRDEELLVGIPAERLLRRADLVLAERRAVRLRRVDGVRRAEARCASGRR